MRAYISTLSLKDVYYVAAKVKEEAIAREAISAFMEACEVVSVTRRTCEQALCGPESDFEDGLIAAAARSCRADLIISRDELAFNDCGIPKVDPLLFAAFFFGDNVYPHAECENWAVLPY